jgi:hypothetical protein
MEAVTLVMPRQQARQAYLEYRRAVTVNRAPEDDALTKAYREIARGNPVVDLPATMRVAGIGADFYPKLAISRADRPKCRVECRPDGAASFSDAEWHRGRPPSSTRYGFPSGSFAGWNERYSTEHNGWIRTGRPDRWKPEATALVPLVPAALRPKVALEHFAILWEAVWTAVAPRDPMLLKPLGGPFYAVVAVWDLTELERAILRGRL